jgi:hypothetical protein
MKPQLRMSYLPTLIAVLLAGGCSSLSTERGGQAGSAPKGYSVAAAMARADLERAETAYRRADWRQAEEGYQRLTLLAPSDPYPWFRLGNVYAKTDQLERATSAYREALRRNADYPKALHNLALTNLLQAKADLEAGIARLNPNDPATQESQALLSDLQRIIGASGTYVARAEKPDATRASAAGGAAQAPPTPAPGVGPTAAELAAYHGASPLHPAWVRPRNAAEERNAHLANQSGGSGLRPAVLTTQDGTLAGLLPAAYRPDERMPQSTPSLQYYKVLTNSLVIREEPATAGKILQKLARDEQVVLADEPLRGKWVKIVHSSGVSGWVLARHLALTTRN